MKISIHSANDFRLPLYDIVFNSLPQPFDYTDIKRRGTFGSIQLIKTDLKDCSIWLLNYKLDKPVIIQASFSEFIYQLSFKPPAAVLYSELGKGDEPVLLSKVNNVEIALPALEGKMLFIHYSTGYFIKFGNNLADELFQLFETKSALPGIPVSLTAASFSILQQIINASPANKLLHSYLLEKTEELLSLIRQSIRQRRSTSLTGKEIDIVLKAKEIIIADLSVSHTRFSLSKITGGDAYSLSKNFKEWFGIELRQFIHISRMVKARGLLSHSDLAIKKISFSVGYKNVSNFSESFKSYYGYSPSHVRESGDFPGNP